MFIQSKLLETNETLLDVELSSTQESSVVDWKEVNYPVSNDFLDGTFSAAYTAGFCITRNQFHLHQTVSNRLFVGRDFIQISLMSKGESTLKTKIHASKSIQVGLLQLAFRHQCNPTIFLRQDQERYDYTRIFMSRAYFLNLLESEVWSKEFDFFQKVLAWDYVRFGECVLPIDVKTFEVLTEIFDNKSQGTLTRYFLGYKLREFFLMVHSRIQSQHISSELPHQDLNKLKQAKAFLGANFSNPPTIRQLSKEVSLNEQKLKTGFKEAFGQTIRSYVTELRMDQAKVMLREGIPVSEVALNLGYKSVSHFIAAFKKKYGSTPKQIHI
ncbi:helix-turn-helix transcriptional regulator [Algoriphagus vanfongensis]|uniref:helix-turn-helix transcriptional regulator n=1 Tax=Algoriphagus vanfongensis TaxID=426371 RepID=UPI000410DB60|nr:AraC family transcriptional regulator [Algoriphagus vanfongensis]